MNRLFMCNIKQHFFKFYIIHIFIFCIASCQLTYAQYTKLPISSVSEEQKKVATEIIDIAYNDCEKYKNHGLPSKITSSYFKERFATVKITKSCKKSNEDYGEIISAELTEIHQKNKNYYLRYKIKRAKTDWFSEIQIVLNKKNKAVGLTQKNYWTDRIYEYRERLKPYNIRVDKLNDSIIKEQLYIINQSFNNCLQEEVYNEIIEKKLNISVIDRWKSKALERCQKNKNKLGNLNEISFKGYLTDSIAYNRYRYKVQFDSLKKPSEIRLYARLNNTYIGMWIIDVWYDDYIGLSKAIEKSKNELGN